MPADANTQDAKQLIVLTGPATWIPWDRQFRSMAGRANVLDYLDGNAELLERPDDALPRLVIKSLLNHHLERAQRRLPFSEPTQYDIVDHVQRVAQQPRIPEDEVPLDSDDETMLDPVTTTVTTEITATQATSATLTESSAQEEIPVPEPAPAASTSKGKGKAKATTSKAQPSNTPAPTPTPPPTLTIKQRQVAALTAEVNEWFTSNKSTLMTEIPAHTRALRDRWTVQAAGLSKVSEYFATYVERGLQSSHNFRDDNLREFYESLQTIASSSDEVATDIRARLAAHISTLRGRQPRQITRESFMAWINKWENIMGEAYTQELDEVIGRKGL